MRRLASCLVLGFFAVQGHAVTPLAEIPKRGFQPSASTNADPECASLVEHARLAFRTDERNLMTAMPLTVVGNLTAMTDDELAARYGTLPSSPYGRGVRQIDLSTPGRPLFVFTTTQPGCGGGCERELAFIADNSEGKNWQPTAALVAWGIYRKDAARYLLGVDDQKLIAYRLDHAPAPVACEIALTISHDALRKRPEVADVASVVDAYQNAVDVIHGGGGDCGSLGTQWRLRSHMHESFDLLFYRPWAIAAQFEDELEDVRAWSLQGISEFDAYQDERRTYVAARTVLARFYATQLDLSAKDAFDLAGRGLRGAANSGFSFSREAYRPLPAGDGAALRRAILEHRPVTEIANLAVPDDVLNGGAAGESILNVAVRYPEALAQLLKRGANPNIANAFGKTPLMYAAQHDQLESVKLLVAAGADVNAATTEPLDHCYYSLRASGVAPLHYAARYSSAAVIRELLKSGAFTFNATTGSNGYPLGWLESQRNHDRKAALSEQELGELKAALAVPDDATRLRIAATLAEQGARMIRARRYEAAYQALRDAERARPAGSAPTSNASRADFGLIALRAGHLVDSLVASQMVIASASEPDVRAAAWFNTGLACERHAERVSEGVLYDRSWEFCRRHVIVDFVNAWSESPNPAREHKIAEVLDSMRPSCTVEQPSGRELYYVVVSTNGRLAPEQMPQRIIVRHPRGAPPAGDVVEFSQAYVSSPTVTFRTELDRRLDLREFSLTLLRVPGWVQGTVHIRGKSCRIS